MKCVDLLLAAGITVLTVTGWALANRPHQAPPWPAVVSGFAFSPARAGDDPSRGVYPRVESLARDVALLAPRARALRTYSLDGTLAEVPALALDAGLDVIPGAWIDGRAGGGDAERIDRLAALVNAEPRIERVLIGNETVQRSALAPDALAGLLDVARAAVDAEVSTAEPWHVWLANPQLADHVDFLTVHILPYWEGIPVESAVGFVEARMGQLAAAFPGRRIVIGEVGWPTRGRTRGGARASRAAAALFARQFLARAEAAGWEYFLMEAFDQPWKRAIEGDVGGYWGIFDLERRAKLDERGPIVPERRWPVAAAGASAIALACLLVLLLDAGALAWRGRVFLAAVAGVTGSAMTWVTLGQLDRYWSIGGALTTALLALGVVAGTLLALGEAHEWAEARWSARRRAMRVQPAGAAPRLPPVSVHLPIHDEPSALVIATLDALAVLDYPDYEVVVIDNNTVNEAVWRPVQAHCARLGDRFRFFHLADHPGFKAGALNFALAHSAGEMEVVAVVDADYRVEPGWLRDLAGAFADPTIAIVQAPQDYRDGDSDAFKAVCHAEYRGFFAIGMVTRNERNAIIQHGTMTLVRRAAIEAAGGWAEWTVTEDAELGLRLFERGWSAIYVPRSYGRGVTPDSFLDYKRQRARWALGAMQILVAHGRTLFGLAPSALATGQRYHFVAGWLPWIADGLNLVFALAALGWSAAMLLAPSAVDAPVAAFAAVPIVLFAFRLAKVVHLYRACVGATWRETARAALAGLALAPSAGLAALAGLARRPAPFVRTPKHAPRPGLAASLAGVRAEIAIGCALLACAVGLGAATPLAGPDLTVWRATLAVLAAPFLGAVWLALGSARWRPAAAAGEVA